MTRRSFLVLTGSITVTTLLIGCGDNSSSPQSSTMQVSVAADSNLTYLNDGSVLKIDAQKSLYIIKA
ncbi:MAG: hypothetical protein RL154_1266 [Pseudomonadota bacterium]|jgi:hypothetical protein